MHRKSRTVMLIAAMAIACIIVSFSLFSGECAPAVHAADLRENVCCMKNVSGLDANNIYTESSRHIEVTGIRDMDIRQLYSGMNKGHSLAVGCLMLVPAVFLGAYGKWKLLYLKPARFFSARFLCDLFILYQKDGKKRRPVLLTV